jgi:hypothetical protein
VASDLSEVIDGRPGWSITGVNPASYTPGGEWSALVSLTSDPRGQRFGDVWHVALLHNGNAYQTRFAATPGQAVTERLTGE